MTPQKMLELASAIEAASAQHRASFPDGDWRAANEELGRLWYETAPILLARRIDPWAGGNEGCIKTLRRIAEQEARA